MNGIQFIQAAQDELHRSLRAEVRDLTPEQLLFRPTAEANTIAFLLWHFARTEDNIIHNTVREPGPTVWQAAAWNEKFGLGVKDMGTGFTAEQVGSFAPSKDDLLAYFRGVWEASDAAIAALADADLDRVPNPERPQNTAGRTIQSIIIGHGYNHMGEIRFLKGLQGMPFGR
ncbi:MAG: DinB family protein [Chloroflexi bacterium]|nr:DinB family protein [Chloroflexota bacterium]